MSEHSYRYPPPSGSSSSSIDAKGLLNAAEYAFDYQDFTNPKAIIASAWLLYNDWGKPRVIEEVRKSLALKEYFVKLPMTVEKMVDEMGKESEYERTQRNAREFANRMIGHITDETIFNADQDAGRYVRVTRERPVEAPRDHAEQMRALIENEKARRLSIEEKLLSDMRGGRSFKVVDTYTHRRSFDGGEPMEGNRILFEAMSIYVAGFVRTKGETPTSKEFFEGIHDKIIHSATKFNLFGLDEDGNLDYRKLTNARDKRELGLYPFENGDYLIVSQKDSRGRDNPSFTELLSPERRQEFWDETRI